MHILTVPFALVVFHTVTVQLFLSHSIFLADADAYANLGLFFLPDILKVD
jgi:hypothetical protein